ncbi:MAG TPA: family 2 glycosyl transferase, partial [Streptomyces sp.]|nr:family 2 glycosyl transferase [Streptomyces sp.]
TTVPAGAEGRVLRLADSAAEGWTATLDGKPLTRTTVDGWAQGFELPASGGRLDVTYDDPVTHTAWLWAQGALAVVLVVLALPGRRRDIDDDLPEEPAVPAQAVTGEGRRARRLRAQAEAGTADPGAVPSPPQEETPVPAQQQSYGEWDTPAPAPAPTEYQQYQDYGQQYPADAYQGTQYDPYAYGGPAQPGSYEQPYDPAYDQTYQAGYEAPYDPARQPHGSERSDGSQQ